MTPSDFTMLQALGRAWNMVGAAFNKWLRDKAIEMASSKPKQLEERKEETRQ